MADWRPHLIPAASYQNPRAAMEWLGKAFGFEVFMLIEDPSGAPAHIEMRVGDAVVMIGSEWTDDHRSPKSIGGKTTQTVHIHIKTDVGAHCERARAAGAEILAEPETQFYGDRTYRCRDPEGHIWTVAQSVKAVTREEAAASTWWRMGSR